MKLLQCLSLPQRLIICIFNPVLLFFLSSLLLTIWSNYTIIGAKYARTPNVPVAVTVTASSTKTNVNTMVAASPTTTAVTTAGTYYLDSTRLKSIASEYVQERADDVNATLSSFYNSLLSEWQKNWDYWDTSLSVAIENQRARYLGMLAYNNTITQMLYEKSEEINSTWDIFSQTALTAVESKNNQVFQNLSLNYWFVNALFTNISQNLKELESYNGSTENPINAAERFSLVLNNSKLFDNSIANFTGSMIENIGQRDTNPISKRDFSLPDSKSSLFNTSRTLSVICLVTYLVSVLILCVYQWLTYRLETSLFNVHMVEFFRIFVEQQIKMITVQQNMRQYSKDLFSTLNAPLVYYMSNFIDGKSQKFGIGWEFKFYFIFWVCSSGRYLVILLFYTFVHWQIIASLTNNETLSIQKNYLQTTGGLSVREELATNNELSVMANVFRLCTNFTSSVNQIINETLVTQFETLLKQQTKSINSQMSNFVERFNITDPPRWDDLTYGDLCLSQNYGVSVNKLTYNVINYAINADTPESAQGKISRRSIETISVSYENLTWDTLYRWAMLSIVIILFLHLILGLTVFPRL